MIVRVRNRKIDITKLPFKGIMAEIARERGVSRQAVQQAAKKGSPNILERIAEKVEERKGRSVTKHRLNVYDEPARKKGKERGGRVSELIPQWVWSLAA